jgi:hypothetical protein
MKKSVVTFFLPLLFLLCSNYENPFTIPSNAKIYVTKDKTSFNTDTISNILIFSRETLTVTPTVPEQLLWLYIEIPHNRLRPFDTVWHPKAIDYPFIFSCYDTGLQNITIKIKRVNGEEFPNNHISIRAKSPLHQEDLGSHEFTDSIVLTTDSVRDPVIYNWNFGIGGSVISSPYFIQKTIIQTATLDMGVLYITDNNGFTSPADTFTFSFYDNTPPMIVCVNDLYNSRTDTVTTTDSIFRFKILANDRNDLPVASLEFGDEKYDMKNNNVYTKIIKNMQVHPSDKPLIITVKATDNFGNPAQETFYLVYDKNAVDNGISTLDILGVNEDTIKTNLNSLPLLFRVSNTAGKPVYIKSKINDYILNDTVFDNGSGFWERDIPLIAGQNTFEISLFNKNGDEQKSRIITIILIENNQDQTAPYIISYELTNTDNASGNQVNYSDEDSIEFFVQAYDLQSGIKSLSINEDTILINSSKVKLRKKYRKASHSKPEDFVLSITDNQNNTSKDTLLVRSNHVPTFASTQSLPFLLNIGVEYTDTLMADDEDRDPVTFKFRYVPSNMIIDSTGRLFFKPDTSNLGKDSIIVQLTDGYQYSKSYTLNYRIIDPANDRPSVKLLKKQQFPSFIQAGENLKIPIVVDTSTGHSPLLYTVKVTPFDTMLLNNSLINDINWTPSISDTGEQFFTCIVKDSSYRQYDTLVKSILVVRPNSDPCTLSLPEGIYNNQKLNLFGVKDTSIEFTINDSDDPLTEEHIVTVINNGNTLKFPSAGLNFTINITPSGKELDTISVSVTDKTIGSNGYSVTIPVLFRLPNLSDIPGLTIWIPPEKLTEQQGTVSWTSNTGYSGRFRSGETNNPAIITGGPNGYKVLKFYRNEHIDDEDRNVFSIDTGFSIFAVVKYLSDKSYENRTILSSTTGTQTTGFGVDCDGHPVIYTTRNSRDVSVINSKSRFSVAAEKWFVASYRSNGIRNGSLKVVSGVNYVSDTISLENPQAGPQLILGSSISNNNQYVGWIGEMAEIAIFTRRLSENETNSVIQYFFNKFALKE